MTPEGKVKRSIQRELDARGLWRAGGKLPPERVIGWYWMPVPNGLGVHGIPDFVGVLYGLFFAIEAKAPGGKLTPNQERRHEEIRAAGGIVLTVSDAQEVREFLDAMEARYGKQAEQSEAEVR